MGIFFGNDDTTYTSLRPIDERVDANGKIWVYARAETSLTALHPQILRKDQNGWIAFAPYDTGLASTTAAARVGFKIGIAAVAIPSGSDGWMQIGGRASMLEETMSVTTGNFFRWVDATMTGAGIAAATFTVGGGLCDTFGIAMATTSATTFDIFLMNKWVCGTT